MTDYIIKNKDLNKSIRLAGSIIRRLSPYFTESSFHKKNEILDRFVKGHWLSHSTSVKERFIKRKDGSKLRVLICTAKKPVPDGRMVTGLLWLHGGGYAIGVPEQDFLFASRFCKDGSCVAILPDYRRSTEAPYPAALEDSYLTLKWMWHHADRLGINKRQLFVGGDSAGGGLAAAVCLYNRDKGSIPIAFQLPLYPMLDDREITGSSQNNDAPVWNTISNRAGWNLYLSSFKEDEHIPCYAAPARAADYSGLPPACTYVGTVEPFHDETIAFCKELKKAKTPVHLREFPGCFHAFDQLPFPAEPAKQARQFLMDTFRYAQKNYFADKSNRDVKENVPYHKGNQKQGMNQEVRE